MSDDSLLPFMMSRTDYEMGVRPEGSLSVNGIFVIPDELIAPDRWIVDGKVEEIPTRP